MTSRQRVGKSQKEGMTMNEQICRIQVRLQYDRPEERVLIEKIKNRNRILHKNISDYVKHAIYAFEEPGNIGAGSEIPAAVTESEVRCSEAETPDNGLINKDMDVFQKEF